MSEARILVVGGGAAGVFGAIACAEANPGCEVTVLEKGGRFLDKVRISGGGRCNVTHACFEAREFVERYPRGRRELLGPFHEFQASDTVAWFESRGVRLKTEADGRMFPVTDSSQTIVDCLLGAARDAGVRLRTGCEVAGLRRRESGGFDVSLAGGERLGCDRLLLAPGGCRGPAAGRLAESLGHGIEPPVPSLFTFQIEAPWLTSLAGVSVPEATLSVAGTDLKESGPLLVTHWGLSGPSTLRLSAWGARALHAAQYRFPLRVSWLGAGGREVLRRELARRREEQGARRVCGGSFGGVPVRLWERLVARAGLSSETRWASLTRAEEEALLAAVMETELNVVGKSLNKDEFVTCGGVRLAEVRFKTMESRVCPGLHLAGEYLDIDGVTGGFNFQAAWTTGWIAGRAMAM